MQEICIKLTNCSLNLPDSLTELTSFMKLSIIFILPEVNIGVKVERTAFHSSPLRLRSC